MLNQEFLQQLKSEFSLGKVLFKSTLTSTNALAAEWVQENCPNLSLIVADEQTSGRGRYGRKWYTNPGSALALSLIITRPTLPIHLYNGLSAVSLLQAFSEFTDNEIKIKWPNDILIDGKKVCGMLIETSWMGDQITGIIIGIGINVFETSLDINENLRYPAAFLQQHTRKTLSRKEILKKVLSSFVENHQPGNQEHILEQWNRHLAFKYQDIQAIRREGQSVTGKLLRITTEGHLEIELPDSSIVVYNPNEIQNLRPT